ncbi:hypothetical protein [Streptomyces sp. NBC_01565]|uniref:hypothetical protein n=1 Tax=Streptomyces sp. NBC_01565 TaxID=2975881 RepID=UPI00225B5B94|nr:hypothetical protein [Streptomyces sp. NBC_01565]MCX4546528.1 hypothetical protein [Streptomyces sp. NBC_01565]
MLLLLLLEFVDDRLQPIGVRHFPYPTGTWSAVEHALLAAVGSALGARLRGPVRAADLLVQRHTLRPLRRGRSGPGGQVPQACSPQVELSPPVFSDFAGLGGCLEQLLCLGPQTPRVLVRREAADVLEEGVQACELGRFEGGQGGGSLAEAVFFLLSACF